MTTLYNKYFNYLKWNYFISSDAQIKIDYGSQRVIYAWISCMMENFKSVCSNSIYPDDFKQAVELFCAQ